MSFDVGRFNADTTRTINKIRAVLERVQDKKVKREILEKASEPVVKKAQSLAPVGEQRGGVLGGAVSATYNTPKLIGGIRTPKGKGVIKSRFMPRNLRLAIRTLVLRKTARVFIGPRVKRRTPKRVGTSARNANAFYAQMIYGSARAFQKNIMIAALQSTKSRAAQIVAREARKALEAEKQKQGLK